jgi:hypothetical protein
MFLFIISDILDFSQISLQKFRIKPNYFSIKSLLKDIKELFEFSAEK